MKTLIIYDSYFGNTEKIANTIGGVLKGRVLKVENAKLSDLEGIECLVVGSPTRAFSPTPSMKQFLKNIPVGNLKGVKVASFDTRMDITKAPGILKFLAGIFGYAAEPMAKILMEKGATQAIEPVGFFVKESEGPLADGELKRAEEWVKKIK